MVELLFSMKYIILHSKGNNRLLIEVPSDGDLPPTDLPRLTLNDRMICKIFHNVDNNYCIFLDWRCSFCSTCEIVLRLNDVYYMYDWLKESFTYVLGWFGFNCRIRFINDQSFGLHAHEEEGSTGDSHDHSEEHAFIWKALVVLASIYGFYLFEILTRLGLQSKVGIYNLSSRPVQWSVSDPLALVEHEKCEVFPWLDHHKVNPYPIFKLQSFRCQLNLLKGNKNIMSFE